MGYILNFQNKSNNMKNEIIRKITSLTLMTIMFAGGMTLAIPGFLPDSAIPIQAFAAGNESTTVGMLTVSTTEVQAGQVVKVTINDPSNANPMVTSSGVTSDFNASTLYFNQMVDGSWVAYVADQSTMLVMDSASFDYGASCLVSMTGGSNGWTNGGNKSWSPDTTCASPGTGAPDAAGNTVGDGGSLVLKGTTAFDGPYYNGQTGIDEASWPYITGFEFNDSNIITYGDDSIIVTYGTNNAGNSITGPGDFVVPGQQLQVTIDDNGLNYDPTTAEKWTFGSVTGTTTVARTTGDTADIRATLGIGGFGTNGVLTLTDSDEAICVAATSGCPSASTYVFVETATNSGVFEVHDFAGESTVDVKGDASVDEVVTFCYGGNCFASTVATNNASASLDAGANWAPGEAATYTVTDPDMNKIATIS